MNTFGGAFDVELDGGRLLTQIEVIRDVLLSAAECAEIGRCADHARGIAAGRWRLDDVARTRRIDRLRRGEHFRADSSSAQGPVRRIPGGEAAARIEQARRVGVPDSRPCGAHDFSPLLVSVRSECERGIESRRRKSCDQR